jgi:glutamate-5-semialdehyde dehydrogenase
MNYLLSIEKRNLVLRTMASLVQQERDQIIQANKLDLNSYNGDDLAMEERLKVDNSKIDEMILSLNQLALQPDPVGVERFEFVHENGIKVSNKTAAFGTILIIYESRPDVTIEAAGIAFKSGNKILLKGGKEAALSNLKIVDLWHQALQENNIEKEWVEYLNFNREQTQAFLEKPTQKVDLIVPRGGEKLIEFVKEHASCPVIISGRGNNFVYVHQEADTNMALKVILNAKTSKISACNAIDKIIIDASLPDFGIFITTLVEKLMDHKVEIIVDKSLEGNKNTTVLQDESIWYEEFLDYKIVIGSVASPNDAIAKINAFSGGHSAAIITKNNAVAQEFMERIDCAAVYHNASTRFTDGGQLGLGGELAISTDKLHQRGPIGLQHLVTNKWYIYGEGQIRL